jgi:integration host factor subunit beta
MKRQGIEDSVYAAHGGLTRREVETVVSEVLDLIKAALVAGERVKLKGFGVLEVVGRKGKRGKHPKTGQTVVVAPRRTVVYHHSRNTWQGLDDGSEE